jgi:hypothetical protein
VQIVGFFLGSAGLLYLLPLMVRARPALRPTTLLTAWNWGMAALVLWCAAWIGTLALPESAVGWVDLCWYLAALLLLCATVAVLGAKRPGARVWGWFVLVPLMCVLGWPTLFTFREGVPPQPLVLMDPAVLAFGVVCVMGVGNYFGTRFAPAAGCLGLALVAAVAPFGGARVPWPMAAETSRIVATCSLAAAGGLARMLAMVVPEEASAFDRLWFDFRDYFGIVWGRRIQDRFNDAAAKSNWPARIGLDGFHWEAGTSASADQREAIEAALRWLLRRFVDPDWIDRRLQTTSREPTP